MTITFERLDAPLGVRAHGIPRDRPLATDEVDSIKRAIDEHLVVLFHNDTPLPAPRVVELCESFGTLKPTLADKSRLPGYPGINRVSNRDADGVVGTGGSGIVTYHSDLSFTPPLIEFLYLDALELPTQGGDTKWVNLCAAYDDLPAATKARIEGVGVHYRLRAGLDFDSYFKASDSDVLLRDETVISLVQTNARTGRKSVWPNTGPDFSARVEGLSATESADLLRELFEHCTQARYEYRHHWSVGDSALWINTQTLHEREGFPSDQVRVLRHVNILGVADPRQLAA
jgi:taurine dioxygenase